MPEPLSWSQLYRHRREAAARFGKIFDLPLRKRVRDVLVEQVSDGQRVLEIGAGDRAMGDFLRSQRPGIAYRSLDIDAQSDHDYRSMDDIGEQFDVIYALEVVEHLTLDEIRSWLPQIRALLSGPGHLVLSTPN